jgi:hypothetical protein
MMQGTQADLLGAVGKNVQVAAKCIVISMAPGGVVLVLTLGSTALQSLKSRSDVYSRRHRPAGRGLFWRFSEVHPKSLWLFMKCIFLWHVGLMTVMACGPPRMAAEPHTNCVQIEACVSNILGRVDDVEDVATHPWVEQNTQVFARGLTRTFAMCRHKIHRYASPPRQDETTQQETDSHQTWHSNVQTKHSQPTRYKPPNRSNRTRMVT